MIPALLLFKVNSFFDITSAFDILSRGSSKEETALEVINYSEHNIAIISIRWLILFFGDMAMRGKHQ